MDKIKERVEKLREKMRLRIEARQGTAEKRKEERIKLFIDSIIEEFEQCFERSVESTHGDISSIKKTIERVKTDLDFYEFRKVAEKFEELGFGVQHFYQNAGNASIKITLFPE